MPFEFILVLFLLLIAEPLFYMRKKLQLGAAITEVNVPTQERVIRLIGIFCIVYLFVFRDASQTGRFSQIFQECREQSNSGL